MLGTALRSEITHPSFKYKRKLLRITFSCNCYTHVGAWKLELSTDTLHVKMDSKASSAPKLLLHP